MNTTTVKVFIILLLWVASMALIKNIPILHAVDGVTLSENTWNVFMTATLRLGLYFGLLTIANQIVRRQDKNMNSLYYKCAGLIFFTAVTLIVGPMEGTDTLTKKNIGGFAIALLFLFPMFITLVTMPLMAMHFFDSLFLKNPAFIVKSKDDISLPAGLMIVLAYMSLVLNLSAEIFIEQVRVEAICMAVLNSLAIVVGFIQLAKLETTTGDYRELKESIRKRSLSEYSYGLIFASAVAVVAGVAILIVNGAPDVPLIVVIGAASHLIATIVIGARIGGFIIDREIKRIEKMQEIHWKKTNNVV